MMKRISVLVCPLLFLIACGGGGADPTPPPDTVSVTPPPSVPAISYTGKTDLVDVNDVNVEQVASEISSALFSADILVKLFLDRSQISSGQYNEMIAGDLSGSAHIQAAIGSNNNGWISIDYSNYSDVEGVVLEGLYVQRYTTSTGRYIQEFHDLNLSVDDNSLIYRGTLSIGNEDSYYARLLVRDRNSSAQIELRELDVRRTREYINNNNEYSSEFSGRIFMDSIGFTEVSTTLPVRYTNFELDSLVRPISGQLDFTSSDDTFSLLPLSSRYVALSLSQVNSEPIARTLRTTWDELEGKEDIYSDRIPLRAIIADQVSFSSNAQQRLVLNGLLSSSAEGFVEYQWELLNTPPNASVEFTKTNTPRPEMVADSPGTYLFKLTVSDGLNVSSQMKVFDLYFDENPKPEVVYVEASTDVQAPVYASVGEVVLLDASMKRSSRNNNFGRSPSSVTWGIATKPETSALLIDESTTSGLMSFIPDVPGDYLISFDYEDINNDSTGVYIIVEPDYRFKPSVDLVRNENLGRFSYPLDNTLITDIDNDGDKEIFIKSTDIDQPENYDPNVYNFFKKNEKGVFDKLSSNPVGAGHGYLKSLDQDSQNEIFVNDRDKLRIYEFSGDTLSLATELPIEYCGLSVSHEPEPIVMDINNDGSLDLLHWCARSQSDYLDLYLSTSSGLEKTQTIVFPSPFAPEQVIPGDFNSDGFQDLVAFYDVQFNTNLKISFYYNDQAGSFLEPVDIEVQYSDSYPDMAVMDIDGDNKDDMLIYDGFGRLLIELLQADNGEFVTNQIDIPESDCFLNNFTLPKEIGLDMDVAIEFYISGNCINIFNRDTNGAYTITEITNKHDQRSNSSYTGFPAFINKDDLLDVLWFDDYSIHLQYGSE